MYVVSLLSCVTIDNDQKVTILSAAVQFELRISSLMSFITSLLLWSKSGAGPDVHRVIDTKTGAYA
ncbi:hypothetical protein CFP56_003175 [Quercus suber]|uniref:Uncharacterized protein n=1 Tax=Quercus suber TaxID=58331 RepID=A0AAW0IJG1_QUESU